MITRRHGTWQLRIVHAAFSLALRLFFRRIERSHEERVPLNEPVIFVVNHPNGLLDPALVYCALPRRVSFLAKSTLFKLPVVGWVLRTAETLPLYRRLDNADVMLNQRTFHACYELLRQGRCIALFPEGLSVPTTKLLPVKTGAARIALGAISLRDTQGMPLPFPAPLKIMPVGLYYTSLTKMRGEVLMRFGEPFVVAPVTLEAATGEPSRADVRDLNERIEQALRAVTLNVADNAELDEITRAEEIFSSVYETLDVKQSLSDTFILLRRLAAGISHYRAADPQRLAALRARIKRYENELVQHEITPRALSLDHAARWRIFWRFFFRAFILLLLLPLSLAGALAHLPAHLAGRFLAARYYKHDIDESVSTVQILSAMMFMPLTWLTLATIAYFKFGWRIALIALPLTILCGYVALRSFETFVDMHDWFNGLLLLFKRRGLFLRLLVERRALHHELAGLGNQADPNLPTAEWVKPEPPESS